MIRRKARGFRLGRFRLVKIWRWALRRRPRRNYCRLEHSPLLSPYHSQTTSLVRNRSTTAVTRKLVHWGRSLTRHLRPSSLWHCTSPRGGERGERCRLLGGAGEAADESKPPPKGHLAVYVGDEKDSDGVAGSKRYVVPVIYFNHPLFGELLRETEEEFGFHHSGGITIPCPVARFERVQTCIASEARRA